MSSFQSIHITLRNITTHLFEELEVTASEQHYTTRSREAWEIVNTGVHTALIKVLRIFEQEKRDQDGSNQAMLSSIDLGIRRVTQMCIVVTIRDFRRSPVYLDDVPVEWAFPYGRYFREVLQVAFRAMCPSLEVGLPYRPEPWTEDSDLQSGR